MNLFVASGNAVLHTLAVDGAAASASIVYSLNTTNLINVDVTVMGGSGNDTFSTAVGTGHKATLNGARVMTR
jgi:hypothetical protein